MIPRNEAIIYGRHKSMPPKNWFATCCNQVVNHLHLPLLGKPTSKLQDIAELGLVIPIQFHMIATGNDKLGRL
jgi:hypothetical protein